MTERSQAEPGRPGLVALKGRPVEGLGARTGKVWLVGAGPGDPDLLTVKALRLLSSADVLVYDRLIPDAILGLARPAARRLYVGKRKSLHSVPQADLNDLLVALAREGLQVVRLKGGDPFVFGRGGEELLACRAAGVPCEIVPGISAALAASASLGAPLTHRAVAQTVSFVTGHAATGDHSLGEPDLDWSALARPNHTVAVYMGLTTAETMAARLIAAGRAPSTPVLIVQHASRPDQRQALTTLCGLAEAAQAFDAPSLLIIGEVAAMADLDLPVLAAASAPAQAQGKRA